MTPPDLSGPAARPYRLPVAATPLIGREEPIRAILEMLAGDEVRMLTVTGPPGIGKTRLALAVAERAGDPFPQGVCFVPLAALTDRHLVLPAIAGALGLEEPGDGSLAERLRAFLQEKRMLLVLDNFEQVAGAALDIGALVEASAALRVLVTSRVQLQIYSEHQFAVAPLTLPALMEREADLTAIAGSEAVQLFVRRARAANRLFRLTEHNSRAIAELCVALEGVPLALELAAARTGLLPPQAILARLRQPRERLHLLVAGAKDLPARQRTLRAAIDWSYDLLNLDEQQLFRRLAVFRGGWTLAAAEAVCGPEPGLPPEPGRMDGAPMPVLDVLGRLLGSSLARLEETPADEGRFGMLETIREYALERLEASSEGDALRRRHARYFGARVAEVAATVERGTQQPDDWRLLALLEAENENLRAALDWAVRDSADGDCECAEIGLRLAGGLRLFWETRNHAREGREWCARVLQLPRLAGRSAERNQVLFGFGRLAMHLGDMASARTAFEESLRCWRELGDAWGMSLALIGLGQCALSAGDYADARTALAESLCLRQRLGHEWGIAAALQSLAQVAHAEGDAAQAAALLEQALLPARRSGNGWVTMHCLNDLAPLLLARGDDDRALTLLQESLALAIRLDERQLVVGCLLTAARAAMRGSYRPQAAMLLGAADLRLEIKGADTAPHRNHAAVQSLRAALGDSRFQALWDEGRQMPLADLPTVLHALRGPAASDGDTSAAPDPPPTWADLTPREFEVLQLLAQGLSNAEISTRLVISPHTVSMHVRAIFSKLGVRSRSAATRYAFIHHIV